MKPTTYSKTVRTIFFNVTNKIFQNETMIVIRLVFLTRLCKKNENSEGMVSILLFYIEKRHYNNKNVNKNYNNSITFTATQQQ